MLVHASLFSGIGGFDLAAEWMGWDNLFHCEWNPFGQRVLKHHFPNSISYNDITKTDFTIHEGAVDILTGGFPCQPYSSAGKRLGKEDERHLWPEMLRTIQQVKPRWVVGENVRGLTNWNGGLVFNEVQVELENEGYEVQPYLLPAAGVNAPHRRDRIWFIAYNDTNSKCTRLEHGYDARNIREKKIETQSKRGTFTNDFKANGNGKEFTTDTNLSRFETERKLTKPTTQNKRIINKSCRWLKFPTKPPICGGNDGIPRELDSITFPKWRNESIKAYGNAIVPQVAHQIFKAIEEFEIMVNK